jgi:hypothetical protein
MDLPDLGTVTGEITVSVPLKGWTFEATQLQPAVAFPQPCDVRIPARLVPAGADSWRLVPAGPAGRYRIDVFGRAPGGGDLIAAFAVTTTRAGSTPAPQAGLSAFYDHDGSLDDANRLARVDADAAGPAGESPPIRRGRAGSRSRSSGE